MRERQPSRLIFERPAEGRGEPNRTPSTMPCGAWNAQRNEPTAANGGASEADRVEGIAVALQYALNAEPEATRPALLGALSERYQPAPAAAITQRPRSWPSCARRWSACVRHPPRAQRTPNTIWRSSMRWSANKRQGLRDGQPDAARVAAAIDELTRFAIDRTPSVSPHHRARGAIGDFSRPLSVPRCAPSSRPRYRRELRGDCSTRSKRRSGTSSRPFSSPVATALAAAEGNSSRRRSSGRPTRRTKATSRSRPSASAHLGGV